MSYDLSDILSSARQQLDRERAEQDARDAAERDKCERMIALLVGTARELSTLRADADDPTDVERYLRDALRALSNRATKGREQ